MTDAQKMFIEVIIQMLERGELEFDGVNRACAQAGSSLGFMQPPIYSDLLWPPSNSTASPTRGLLQALAGIPDGDNIAASVFSDVHFDWRSASRTARAARIRSWLNMEHHHYS